MKSNKIFRSAAIEQPQGRTIRGLAVVTNSWSKDLGGFREMIRPEALTAELIANSDIMLNVDHDPSKVLARSKYGQGSLKLEITSRGLEFETEAPATQLGNDMLEMLRRGDYSQCSFCFTIPDGGDEWYQAEDGLKREIKSFDKLYDVSVVYDPAYDETEVDARALEMIKRNMQKSNLEIDMKNKRKKFTETRKFILDMIDDARKEARELTDEEMKLIDEQKNELQALAEEIKANDEKLDALEQQIPDDPSEEKADEEEETEAPEEKPEEQPEENPEEKPEEAADEEPEAEEKPEEKEGEDEEEQQEKPEDEVKINTEEPEEDSDDKTEKDNRKFMSNFSFIKAIRSVVNNERADELTQAVLDEGAKSFRDAGLSASGQIQVPMEKRTFTVTTAGDDVVETEFQGLEIPRYPNRVLSKAKWYTGLVGDVQIPYLEAGEAARWEGEVTTNKEITNGSDSIKLTPHRLSVTTKISKTMLAQDSIGVENAIREDLFNNLYNKLEATFLSDEDADGNIPAGIFCDASVNTVTDYKGICELEAELEEQNYNGVKEYVFSPSAKAAFRQMTFGGGKVQRMVMEGNEVDGTPYSYTTNIEKDHFGLLDWSSVRCGQWAGVDLVVDPYTGARENQIILTLNAYFDCKVAHPELVLYGTVKE
jgi:HK97 family phage prohead protease/HK97 family phage major capsid protein